MTELSSRVWVDPLVVIALVSSAAGALAWCWRKVLRPLALMATDWHGTPSRPGVPGRPGVMQRLEAGDERMGRIEAYIGITRAPVYTNDQEPR